MADNVNHPSHYNQGKREVIEEMRLLFGLDQVMSFCKLNAYKYMRRADYKGNKEEDMKKAEWYMDYLEKMRKEQKAIVNSHRDGTITVFEEIRDALNKNNELTEKAVSTTNETLEICRSNNNKKIRKEDKAKNVADFFRKVAFSDLDRLVNQGYVKYNSDEYFCMRNDCEARYRDLMKAYEKGNIVSHIMLDYFNLCNVNKEFNYHANDNQ